MAGSHNTSRFGIAADRAGVCFCSGRGTSCLLGDGPTAECVGICFSNRLSLRGIAFSTDKGLNAGFFTGRRFGNCASVPSMVGSFSKAAD